MASRYPAPFPLLSARVFRDDFLAAFLALFEGAWLLGNGVLPEQRLLEIAERELHELDLVGQQLLEIRRLDVVDIVEERAGDEHPEIIEIVAPEIEQVHALPGWIALGRTARALWYHA